MLIVTFSARMQIKWRLEKCKQENMSFGNIEKEQSPIALLIKFYIAISFHVQKNLECEFSQRQL